MVTHKTKTESTKEKVARLRRKRFALEQDKKQFGCYPDLDEDEIKELQWLSDYEDECEAIAMECYEEKRHGL